MQNKRSIQSAGYLESRMVQIAASTLPPHLVHLIPQTHLFGNKSVLRASAERGGRKTFSLPLGLIFQNLLPPGPFRALFGFVCVSFHLAADSSWQKVDWLAQASSAVGPQAQIHSNCSESPISLMACLCNSFFCCDGCHVTPLSPNRSPSLIETWPRIKACQGFFGESSLPGCAAQALSPAPGWWD